MSDFSKCLRYVLSNEDSTGACKTVPDSPEGCFAISGVNSRSWPSEFAAINALPQDKRLPAVVSFYERRYWTPNVEGITSNNIAAYLLDASVNQGTGTAVRMLQNALRAIGEPVEVDGLLGINTRLAVNSVPVDRLLNAFMIERIGSYKAIGGPNLPGWLARAQRMPNLD